MPTYLRIIIIKIIGFVPTINGYPTAEYRNYSSHPRYVRIRHVRIEYVGIRYVRIRHVRIEYVGIRYVRIEYVDIRYERSVRWRRH